MYGTQAVSAKLYDDGAYSIRLTPAGIVEVVASGFWDIQTARRYWVDVGPYLIASRSQLGRAKALIDKRGSPLQSQEVAACLVDGCQRYYLDEDRIAMILDTSLQKMQARRAFPADRMKAFISYAAAVSWLTVA